MMIRKLNQIICSDGKPSMSHGTLILVPLLSADIFSEVHNTSWSAFIDRIDENKVTILV